MVGVLMQNGELEIVRIEESCVVLPFKVAQ